ncbi:Nudix hydrolase 1 [Chlorella vulgaris]
MDSLQQQLSDVRDQLGGALEFAMDDVRQKWKEMSGGPSVTEGLSQFVHAVDWSERWIQGLLAFHFLLLLLVLLFRRIPGVHGAIFLGMMPLGIFTSALLSAPLLLIMFVILVNYLISTSVLLVRMKRKELQYKARQQQREQQQHENTAGTQQQSPAGGSAREVERQEAAAPAATAAGGLPLPAAQEADKGAGKVHNYPDEPRVGVGVVILRQLLPGQPEVLLIRRAKEPAKGLWCFPGGSMELGETLVDCAVRETLEETGLQLKNAAIPEGELFSDTLKFPCPIAAADSLTRDAEGRLLYHYAIVNMAAVPQDPLKEPVPADDVDAAQWYPVAQLRGLPDLVVQCDRVAERAVKHFTISHE